MQPLIRDLWQGWLPLWVTCWIFGVGGNMSFVALLLVTYVLLAPGGIALLRAIYLLSLAWFIWIFGGIWRSAGRYDGPAIWAALARLGVCVGAVRMAGEAALLGLMTTATAPADHVPDLVG